MKKNNLYKILGVNQNSNQDEIKKAWRQKARENHPDTTGCGESEKFREIQEAYETLSDERRRKQYDQQEERRCSDIPVETHSSSVRHQSSFFNLFDLNEQFSFRDRMLELVLSPQEARIGVQLPLEIQHDVHCPQCHGIGGSFFFTCPVCGGQGFVRQRKQIVITIPAGVAHNSEFDLVVADSGERLRLKILIA